jgi:hypothetical protein
MQLLKACMTILPSVNPSVVSSQRGNVVESSLSMSVAKVEQLFIDALETVNEWNKASSSAFSKIKKLINSSQVVQLFRIWGLGKYSRVRVS